MSQVPLAGTEVGLAAENTAKFGMELVIKTRLKSVNGTRISIGKFPPEKRDYLFKIPFIAENFQWNESKSRVLFTYQPEFPEMFGKWN